MRKNIFYFISCLFLIVQLISCSNEQAEVNIPIPNDGVNNAELQAAIKAIKEFGMLDNGKRTKALSSEDFIIKDVKVSKHDINTNELKSTKKQSTTDNLPENTDINIYTVSFQVENNNGFAIATGDTRLTKVYAYTENGSLADTVYNKGLAMTLAQVPYICTEDLLLEMDTTLSEYCTIIEFEEDPFNNKLKARGDTDLGGGWYWCERGPLMKTQWNQWYPWNNAVPLICNDIHSVYRGRAPAGCTAIALAQVIAYHDIPASRYNGIYTYSEYNKIPTPPPAYDTQIGLLIKWIGDVVGMKYGCDGSSAWPSDFTSKFQSWGVSVTNNEGINLRSLVYDMVWSYDPQIITGQSSDGAHAWVWDGIKGKFKPEGAGRGRGGPQSYSISGSITVHCNWGWGGDSDGWYAQSSMAHPSSKTSAYSKNQRQMSIVPK